MSHQQADWLDLWWAPLLIALWDSLLDCIHLLDSLEDIKLTLRSHLHLRELNGVSEDSRDMLHKHVLVDHFRKDLSIIDIDTSDVLLVSFYLTQEERRH